TGATGRPEEPFETLVATGRPRNQREYLDGMADRAVDRLAPVEPGAPERPEASRALWREALARGTTSNGVFAAKLMWGYFPDFLARLRTLAGTEGRDGAALVDAALAGVRYVRVKREDKVAQAVSLWRALQTQRWRDEGDA